MATTFELIDKTILVADQASIEFTSIPNTFTDLKLVFSARTNTAQSDNSLDINFNGSSANFSARFLYGTGSSAGSGTGTTIVLQADGGTATSSTFSNGEIYIPNYTSSNYKSFSNDAVTENNSASAITGLLAGLWSNTAAINAIKIISPDKFISNSSFYLYGIKNS